MWASTPTEGRGQGAVMRRIMEGENRLKSILQKEKECFFTHCRSGLHKHHVFEGADRELSEKNGLWIYMEGTIHNGYIRESLHNNAEFNLWMKQYAQRIYERERGSREEFLSLFRQNYLDEPLGKTDEEILRPVFDKYVQIKSKGKLKDMKEAAEVYPDMELPRFVDGCFIL